MRKNRFIAAATGVAAALVLTACGGGAPVDKPSAAAQSFNDADVTFATMMIPHHEQAVEMAELAGTRASDAEIKDLAQKIKGAQDPEIQTMKGWLSAWGKPAPSGGMSGMGHDMPGIMSAEDMKKLEVAEGTAFDRQFAELMTAHHNGAIEMARTEQAQGADPEAKALAKAIETAQQAEVAQMRKILDRL
ncbi:DUF305 domain-containing protein [Nonomuraea sp. NPDC050556]|uniref:DUF305 domain-containing protein n=1 Tax=Nonomuraea sp. NPDC050556 TaxID=3364369 RepID=UPI0037A731B6